MTQSSFFRPAPPFLRSLKILILGTLAISLLSAVCNHLFPTYFGWTSPQQYLSLSGWGIQHLFLWQFISYLFVTPVIEGVSFSFLLSLVFHAFLLWFFGSMIIEKKGRVHFFSLYFLGGIIAALAIYGLQLERHPQILFAGNATALYTLLIAWVMLFPESQLLFLMALPFKAKWLILSIIGANFLIDLSTGEWTRVLAYIMAILFAYFYAVLAWNVHGPFSSLHRMERVLFRLSFAKSSKKSGHPFSDRAKIYDFKTGQAILNDQEFLEAMLSKISLYGKKSLTWRERFRLRRINKRKHQGK